MAVKLHRCSNQWIKLKAHPCWKVEKALIDKGVAYERVHGPLSRRKRTAVIEGTGQNQYPAIQFEDGSWYREQSSEMEKTIRAGRLLERAPQAAPAEPASPEPTSAEPEFTPTEPASTETDAEAPEVH